MTHNTIKALQAAGRKKTRLSKEAVRTAPTRKMRRVQAARLAKGVKHEQ